MESAVTFGGGRLLGVLSQPESSADRQCLLILNAGLVYRVGPGRLSWDLAHWAADLGFSSFRFDWSGLGDSAPRIPPLGAIESAVADWRQAMLAGAVPEGPLAERAERVAQREGDRLRGLVWDPLAEHLGEAALDLRPGRDLVARLASRRFTRSAPTR